MVGSTEDERENGRSFNQLRPIELEYGLLNNSDGSISYKQEKSIILVACYGPVESSQKYEIIDRAYIDVSVTSSASHKPSASLAYLIRETITPMIVTALYPRCTIRLDIQIVNSDGDLVASLINSCCLALVDAGIPLHALFSACTLITNKNNQILIDPDYKEEQSAISTITFGYGSNSELPILMQSNGPLSDDNFNYCKTIAYSACTSLFETYKSTLIDKVTKENINN